MFTRDLLDDLGVTDVMDLLRYDVSAEESFGDDAFGGPGVACGIAGGISLASAQSANTASSSGSVKTDDETITLSPFHVNATDDTGYRATNTLDGSRLNTALKDTPGDCESEVWIHGVWGGTELKEYAGAQAGRAA